MDGIYSGIRSQHLKQYIVSVKSKLVFCNSTESVWKFNLEVFKNYKPNKSNLKWWLAENIILNQMKFNKLSADMISPDKFGYIEPIFVKKFNSHPSWDDR